jgi:hypothetical protein
MVRWFCDWKSDVPAKAITLCRRKNKSSTRIAGWYIERGSWVIKQPFRRPILLVVEKQPFVSVLSEKGYIIRIAGYSFMRAYLSVGANKKIIHNNQVWHCL